MWFTSEILPSNRLPKSSLFRERSASGRLSRKHNPSNVLFLNFFYYLVFVLDFQCFYMVEGKDVQGQ